MGLYSSTLGLGAPRNYFGGNSGYVGYSKSKRAVAAENRGLRSKSQMDKSFADEVNEIIIENGGSPVSLKAIKDALPLIRADEWHHTSMYGNKTDYYSARNIANYFSDAKTSSQKTSESHAEYLGNFDAYKAFDKVCDESMGYYFDTLPTSNGVKIAVWHDPLYGGVIAYKGGFDLYENIPATDDERTRKAKESFNRKKGQLLSSPWLVDDKIIYPELIKKLIPADVLSKYKRLGYWYD